MQHHTQGTAGATVVKVKLRTLDDKIIICLAKLLREIACSYRVCKTVRKDGPYKVRFVISLGGIVLGIVRERPSNRGIEFIQS